MLVEILETDGEVCCRFEGDLYLMNADFIKLIGTKLLISELNDDFNELEVICDEIFDRHKAILEQEVNNIVGSEELRTLLETALSNPDDTEDEDDDEEFGGDDFEDFEL